MEVYAEFDEKAGRGEDLSKSNLPTVGSSLQLSRTYTRIAKPGAPLDTDLGVLPEFDVSSDGHSSPEAYDDEVEHIDGEIEELVPQQE